MDDSRKSCKSYDGRLRTLYPFYCRVCKTIVYFPKHVLTTRITCSRKCYIQFKHGPKRSKLICKQCNAEFERSLSKLRYSKSGLYFCSRACKDAAQRIDGIKEIQPDHYGTGIFCYRDSAFRKYGKCCHKCGYSSDERMLDVHHKNGNRQDASLDNLIVLCVWHHAEITRGLVKEF